MSLDQNQAKYTKLICHRCICYHVVKLMGIGRKEFGHPHTFLTLEPNVLTLTKFFFDENNPEESLNDTCKEILKIILVF